MKRIVLACALAATSYLSCIQAQPLLNGSFERADARALPEAWECAPTGGSIVLDAIFAKEGAHSLRMRGMNAQDVLRASQTVDAPASGKKVSARVYARGTDIGAAYLLAEAFDAGHRQIGTFQSAETLSGSTFEEEWKTLALVATFPSDAKTIRISLVARGAGTTWFDAAAVETEGEPLPKAVERPSSLVRSDFTQPVLSVDPGKLWPPPSVVISDDGVQADGGAASLRDERYFRSRDKYPEGLVEMQVAYPAAGHREVGFGFGAGYRRKPGIRFVAGKDLRQWVPTLEEVDGKVTTLPGVPCDGDTHVYGIAREAKDAVFTIDGKECGRLPLTGDWPALPVVVYNLDANAALLVRGVTVKLAPTDANHLADFQSRKFAFRELAYRETARWPDEEKAPSEGGVRIFQRNPLEHLFPNSVARPEELVSTVHASGCPDETVPVLVGVSAVKPLEHVTIAVDDLVSETGGRLPASAVSTGIIRQVAKRLLYNAAWTLDYVNMPMLIEPLEPFALKADESRGVWLDIHLPMGTAAGDYRGHLVVRSSGGERTVPLTITVRPFELEEPVGMTFGVYSTSFYKMKADDPKIVEFLREMRANGMTTLGYMGPNWVSFRGNGEGTRAVFNPFYEKLMQEFTALGFARDLLVLTDASQIDADGRATWGAPLYDEVYRANNAALGKEIERRRWPTHYMQPVDEPSWVSDVRKQRNVHLLKLLKEQSALKTEQDGPPDAYFADEAGPYADMWVCNGQLPGADILAKAKREGRKVLIYNTDVETWRPVVDRYTAGFFQWKYGIDGAMQWQFQTPTEHHLAYEEVSSDEPLAYQGYYYPPFGTNPGGPTVAWKAFRAGITDYRYLQTLQKALAQARASAPDAVREIEEKLERLRGTLKDQRRLRAQGAWTEQSVENSGQPFIAGVFNIDTGWGLDDYDKARETIAEWITRLDRLNAATAAQRTNGPTAP